ncbi:MAG: TRAM domain-containing protein [Dermatophilus congolensis]|nr:TRAM domain-containing protein [Dermatophilus congolensis]
MIGTRLTLEVGDIAHGGHAVARHEGQVVFVRHALPGELVEAVVTKGKEGDRFVFADAVSVLTASPHRVEPRCPVSGPGGCGGCDFQHVDIAYQRELKGRVVTEQLQRLAGIEREVVVEAVPGGGQLDEGLRWRTRLELAVDRSGRAGLRRFRSREVVPLTDCPIAVEAVAGTGVFRRRWPGSKGVDVVVPSVGEPKVVPLPGGVKKAGFVTETVAVDTPAWAGDFRVPTRGFWQVHPGAAATLVGAVLDGIRPEPGERCLDLYAGVGLFAAALADAVGAEGAVTAVESDEASIAAAKRTFHATPQVRLVRARTERALANLSGATGDSSDSSDGAGGADGAVEVVVLDPPRSGAGAEVIEAIAALSPRVVAYVACDPAALARDLATAAASGYELAELRAFDLFPMTHHIECVAILRPVAGGRSSIR